jgi:hypothetical protein
MGTDFLCISEQLESIQIRIYNPHSARNGRRKTIKQQGQREDIVVAISIRIQISSQVSKTTRLQAPSTVRAITWRLLYYQDSATNQKAILLHLT